jgi:hypothetical protein
VAAHSTVEPRLHNSHEFYYKLTRRGIMRVGEEVFAVGPGDLIHAEFEVIDGHLITPVSYPLTPNPRLPGSLSATGCSATAIKLLVRADIDLTPLVTSVYELADAPAAYGRVRTGTEIKVHFSFI